MAESSRKHDIRMYFPWKVPSSLSSEESSDDGLEDSNCENFIKTWKDVTNAYIHDIMVRIVQDIRQEIKVIKSKKLCRYVTKTTHKMLEPMKQNLQNAALNKNQSYQAKDYEEVIHQSHIVASTSVDRIAAHATYEISPSSNCKTLSDFIDYFSKYDQSPENVWKIDTKLLMASFDICITQNKETNKKLLEIIETTHDLLKTINLVTPLTEFIKKDRFVIYKQKIQQPIQVNLRFKSLNRQIWIYFEIIRKNLEELVDCEEKFCKLEEDTLQRLSKFLNSDLDFHSEGRIAEPSRKSDIESKTPSNPSKPTLKNLWSRSVNPSYKETSSSSSDDSWEEYDYNNFITTCMDGAKSYVHNQIEKLVQDTRQSIEVIERKNLLPDFTKTKPNHQTEDAVRIVSDDVPDEKQTYHSRNDLDDNSNNEEF